MKSGDGDTLPDNFPVMRESADTGSTLIHNPMIKA